MSISIDVEKMIKINMILRKRKTCSKLAIEEDFLSLISYIFTNILLDGKMLELFSFKSDLLSL